MNHVTLEMDNSQWTIMYLFLQGKHKWLRPQNCSGGSRLRDKMPTTV